MWGTQAKPRQAALNTATPQCNSLLPCSIHACMLHLYALPAMANSK